MEPEADRRGVGSRSPDDKLAWVSHETIYKCLYVQGRGHLRADLHKCLSTKRAARKTQGRAERRGKFNDVFTVSERPAEAADRAVPGHWEGDLILGSRGTSAIGTLVERSTRFTILLHLPEDRRCHKRSMRPPTAPLIGRGRMISSPKGKARRRCTLAQEHMLGAAGPGERGVCATEHPVSPARARGGSPGGRTSSKSIFATVAANVVRVKYFMPNTYEERRQHSGGMCYQFVWNGNK